MALSRLNLGLFIGVLFAFVPSILPINAQAQRPDDPETAAVVDVGINLLNDARSVLLRGSRSIERGGASISKARPARATILARENELDRTRKQHIKAYVQALESSDSANILRRVVPQLEKIYEATLKQFYFIASGSCLPIEGYEGLCILLPWQERREILSSLSRILGTMSLYGEEVSREGDQALRELASGFHRKEDFGLSRFKRVRTELIDAYRRGLLKTTDLLIAKDIPIYAPCGSLYGVTSFLFDLDLVSAALPLSSEFDWNGALTPILNRYSDESRLWETCRIERLNALEAVQDTIRLARIKGDRIREEEADKERLTLVGEIWGLNRQIEAIELKERIFAAIRQELATIPLEFSKISGVVVLSAVREGVLNSATVALGLSEILELSSKFLSLVDEERDESGAVFLNRLLSLSEYGVRRFQAENRYLGISFFGEMSDSFRSSQNESLWSSERYRQLLTKALGGLAGEHAKFASISTLEAASEVARGDLMKAGDEYRTQLRRRLAIDTQIGKVNSHRRRLGTLLNRSNVHEIYKTVLRDFVQRLSIHPYYPNLQPELDESLSQLTRVFGRGVRVPAVQNISPRTRIVRQALLARRRITRHMTRLVNSESKRLIGDRMTDVIGALNFEKRILERSFPLQ